LRSSCCGHQSRFDIGLPAVSAALAIATGDKAAAKAAIAPAVVKVDVL
jgi:hypothetical protein